MSEALLTCPSCRTHGFTARGLKAHKCDGKNRNASPVPQVSQPAVSQASSLPRRGKPLTLATLDVLPPASSGDPDRDMGLQLTEQYHRATGGMVEVLKFGAMMLQLEKSFSGPHADHKAGKGQGSRGGMREWMRQHAPQVAHSTAMRLKAVTEAIASEYTQIVGAKVAKQFALQDLVTTPAEALPESIRAKQLDLFNYVSGTSQRSWLDRFKPAPSKGGNTYDRSNGKGAPKKLTAAEATALLQTLCANAGQALAAVHKQQAYVALNDAELEGLLDHCDEVAKAVRAWRKLSAAERKDALGAQLARQLESK